MLNFDAGNLGTVDDQKQEFSIVGLCQVWTASWPRPLKKGISRVCGGPETCPPSMTTLARRCFREAPSKRPQTFISEPTNTAWNACLKRLAASS